MTHLHDWAERGAYLFAGVAVVSLTQAALWASLFAAVISIILGAIKLHDRLKYGPNK
jgi:hypothetical protein